MKKLYYKILEHKELWNYYNKEIEKPDLTDATSCRKFIETYIIYAEKSKTVLFDGIDYLSKNDPNRLKHIVSTFFLGIALYHQKESGIKELISSELKRFTVFSDFSEHELDGQFSYVWFMLSLYHDLAYYYEIPGHGNANIINSHVIPSNCMGVPSLYINVYKKYNKYIKNGKDGKEDVTDKDDHGIIGGLYFDKDICSIREYQEHEKKSKLFWGKDLDEVYHYVAWCILSHNIWFHRVKEGKMVSQSYSTNMQSLILKDEGKGKSPNIHYNEYPISFDKYPIFSLFCLVDTLEPIKTTNIFSSINLIFKNKELIIDSHDHDYNENILKLNEWLTPVKIKEHKLRLILNETIMKGTKFIQSKK